MSYTDMTKYSIEKYLEDILVAIYGEEVRHSIHDAIKAINGIAVEAHDAAIDAKDSATQKAEEAAQSAVKAGQEADRATEQANRAKSEADKAANSAAEAKQHADEAGDEADRAGKEAEEAVKKALGSLTGALVPKGTIPFSELSGKEKTLGHLYNIKDPFTSTNEFADGGGKNYPAGSNVYATAQGQWDVLAGNNVVSVNGKTGEIILPNLTVQTGANTNTTYNASAAVSINKIYQADQAAKLGSTTVGSTMQPIYLDAGSPKAASKIPANLSELTNDAGYLKSADVSGSVPPSNTTPKPDSGAGNKGTEAAYARGDHVHPYVKPSTASSADVATKLGTNTVGSTTIPIYLNGGTPQVVNKVASASNADNATNASSANKVKNALTIKQGSNSTIYDGSAAKTITISNEVSNTNHLYYRKCTFLKSTSDSTVSSPLGLVHTYKELYSNISWYTNKENETLVEFLSKITRYETILAEEYAITKVYGGSAGGSADKPASTTTTLQYGSNTTIAGVNNGRAYIIGVDSATTADKLSNATYTNFQIF